VCRKTNHTIILTKHKVSAENGVLCWIEQTQNSVPVSRLNDGSKKTYMIQSLRDRMRGVDPDQYRRGWGGKAEKALGEKMCEGGLRREYNMGNSKQSYWGHMGKREGRRPGDDSLQGIIYLLFELQDGIHMEAPMGKYSSI